MTELELGLMAKQYIFNPALDVLATYDIIALTAGARSSTGRRRYRREIPASGLFRARHPALLGRDLPTVGATAELPGPTGGTRPDRRPHANAENAYLNGYWRLGDDEALVIKLTPAPVAQFWNFYICNRWWEGFDARRGRIYVNSGDLRADADNSMRIVLGRGHSECPTGSIQVVTKRDSCSCG